jgi:putative ABC transport system permease protein
MGAIWQDLRYGARMLRRNPGFALVAILTLAIGIGANVIIFSVVDGVLLRPLPFPDSKRIVTLWETDVNRNVVHGTASAAELLDWRDLNHSFQDLSGWRALYFTITGNGGPEQVWGSQVSGNFFRMLRVAPMLGRDFSAEDEQPGHENVVILSYALWQRHYGGDPGIVGRTIPLDDQPFEVIGILPRNYTLYGTLPEFEIWKPFAFTRTQLDRENHELVIFGRLRDGVRLPQAQGEMESILARLKQQYPGIDQKNGIHVVGFHDELVKPLRPGLLLLLAAVGFVLLIACANVANLMLARASVREREIAIRASLGAGRRRILFQMLTESVLLAAVAAVVGIALAYLGLQLFHGVMPPSTGRGQIPHLDWITINGRVLGFTVIIGLITAVIFGLAPAIQIARSELYESLKEGSRGSTGGRRSHFVRSVLIVSEIAFSVLLLIGAGLLVRSFARMMSEDLGFNPSKLLTMQVFLPEAHYSSVPSIVNFDREVVDRVAALPGVTSASTVNFLPLTGWTAFSDFDIAGRPSPGSGEHFTAAYRVADWRYVHTMGMVLKQGRDFSAADGPDSEGVVLINEALANRYWPGEDPVGKQIKLIFPATLRPWDAQTRAGWLTIIGIVGDVRDWSWSEPKVAQLYLPATQNASKIMRIVVRTNGDPSRITSAVRQVVESVDPNQPVTEVSSMDEFLKIVMAQRRLNMALLAFFAAIAAILAAIGIYGVMSYAVTQRSHEIGIRMALGAEPRNVLGMMVSEGMKLALLGVAIGFASAMVVSKYLESQLYGIKARDPLTFATVAVGLGLVALAACYFPARRATKVDPLSALRYE